MLSDPVHENVPRRLYLKQRDFMAHGDVGSLSRLQSIGQCGRAQDHTEECRTRVEGELRKTEEGKAHLQSCSYLCRRHSGVH